LYDRNLIADMSQADQAGVAIMTHLYLVFRMSVMLPAVLTDRCHPFLQAECRDSTLKYDLAASFHILTSSQFITTYPSHSASYNLCSLNSVVKYDDWKPRLPRLWGKPTQLAQVAGSFSGR
jgi:hypothetical protein